MFPKNRTFHSLNQSENDITLNLCNIDVGIKQEVSMLLFLTFTGKSIWNDCISCYN